MKSFLEYLSEQAGVYPGNYICANCTTPTLPAHLLPKSGKMASDKSHITLMYSKESNVNQKTIANVLSTYPIDMDLDCYSADCFDSIPKNGERDENKGTLVLKIKNQHLDKLHETLKMLGMQHSYLEFSAHVTVAYGVDREEAHECANAISNWLCDPMNKIRVKTTGFESNPIDENWSAKL
jgi:hypothetical protein